MSTVVFHGMTLPDREWAVRLQADVVLQPYHPIVQSQSFGEWFPLARRFVYVNPTAVDRQRRSDVTERMLVHDPDDIWGLPRLRLPEFLDWAVEDAVLIGLGEGVDGLFVDDLDRLTVSPARRDLAIEYARRVAQGASCTLYVNRAFEVIDRLESLEAVLVEDLDRDLAQPGGAAWVAQLVLPTLQRAHHRGIRLHRLEYDADGLARPGGLTPVTGPAQRPRSQVDTVLTSTLRLPEPALDCWDTWSARSRADLAGH